MKIQPIDVLETGPAAAFGKSRLKRLLDRHGSAKEWKTPGGDLEPSSLCLAKMVGNFLEETSEKPSRCGRSLCSCFVGGSGEDSSGDNCSDVHGNTASEIVKSLVPCTSRMERKLLAYVSKFVEKSNKTNKHNVVDHAMRETMTNGLISLGYDASICNSRWEKSPSFPAGEHRYVDVIAEGGERVLIDIEFKSEFEIARPTKTYKSVLQGIPCIFVGSTDRLKKIVAVVSGAAKQSLKKKGLHVPPWRKVEYMTAKWLSPYRRITTTLHNSTKATQATTGEEVEVEVGLELEQRLEKSGEHKNTREAEKPPMQNQPLQWQMELDQEPTAKGTKLVVIGLGSVV